MGCSTSKFDDLPAVALCRDRCKFLEEALHHSYALADAHVAYMNSLKKLGPSLHHFFVHQQNLNHSDSPPSNGDPPPPLKSSPSAAASPDHSTSSSTSHSHVQFDTDSDYEDNRTNYPDHETLTDNFMSLYYTKNEPSQWISHTYPNNSNNNSNNNNSVPPPPVASNSAWDFLNFFDAYEKYELPYAVNVNNRAKDNVEGDSVDKAKLKAEKESVHSGDSTVDKNLKNSEKERNDAVESKKRSGQQDVAEVMRELIDLFGKASDSGSEVLKMLDAGKFRYHNKNSVYQATSKMFHVATLPPSTEAVYAGFDEDVALNATNLFTTLKKLCMWEKKLFDEVKAEEKLRMIHARKCRQMRIFDKKGAEAHKLDSVQTLVRTLSTKMNVSIQVIDKISITINKLRDEELWPQINDLINRLLGMWRAMLECHRCQSQAVAEAKNFDAVSSIEKINDAHLEAAIQLRLELQNWNLSFSHWIDAQKGYINALNGWLMKCLLYEPEETPDGITPFSPGRIGAPPVFVICCQWSQAMDRISEKEVIESMHGFLTSVNQLLERHTVDLQQRVLADKNMERRVKISEREEQRIRKLMLAREKKKVLLTGEENVVLLAGEIGHQSAFTNSSSLHSGLDLIFVSMEKLAANFMQAHEELYSRIEEVRLYQNSPDVP
ncbi:DUF632 domain-containing protein/DUF630 domain-containing protein [Cephalotus follicularis]|uniref:DUF632 domain-containing protein/DUF630 domain-containing protein n=1 Tax=Cephalotus follicularis TaxID=3775 RepID=A0A1Q3B6Q7_CEPFO|nr:DUF632 domain-containing protein/DUF630 domain-containing protein [Cephalotus follicularis]